MQKLVITGGIPLEGTVTLQGAKNSVLPILAASLLCRGETVLENCPRLTDVFSACRILTALGCRCSMKGHVARIQADGVDCVEISESLMQEMRSSIIFLGALLGRYGSCTLSYPGGCELGPRPIDMHLQALRSMGAEIAKMAEDCSVGQQKDCMARRFRLSIRLWVQRKISCWQQCLQRVRLSSIMQPESRKFVTWLLFCGSAEQRFTVMVATLSRLKAFLHYMEQFTGLCQTESSA